MKRHIDSQFYKMIPIVWLAFSLSGMTPALISPEFLANLRQLLVEPWPTMRDSIAVNESKEFALRLGEIGQRWRSQPVIDCSRILHRDAGNYSVADLEKHVEEFSTLVEEMKTDNK